MIAHSLLLVSVLSIAQTALASSKTAAPPVHELRSRPDWPAARPGDVGSIHGIVEAFFDAISAPKGGTLDRERLLSLFVPDGRIEIPIPASRTSQTDVVFLSPCGYADSSDAGTKDEGFFDRTLAVQVEQYGVMAHVFATYESRKNQSDSKPFIRGVKAFELLNSGGRWYITQVAWDRERPDNPIPEIYLHDSLR
jgi:hypothetical protein